MTDNTLRTNRALRGVAGVLALAALALYMSDPLRGRSMDWPGIGEVVGVLILMAANLLTTSRGRLHRLLSAAALALIAVSTVFLFARLWVSRWSPI